MLTRSGVRGPDFSRIQPSVLFILGQGRPDYVFMSQKGAYGMILLHKVQQQAKPTHGGDGDSLGGGGARMISGILVKLSSTWVVFIWGVHLDNSSLTSYALFLHVLNVFFFK